MSEQDNLNIVRKEFDAFNSHNVDLSVQHLADTARVMDVSYARITGIFLQLSPISILM
jgi:hypothetical protein